MSNRVSGRLTDRIVNVRVQVRNLPSLKHFRTLRQGRNFGTSHARVEFDTRLEVEDVRMLGSTVELLGGLCLSALTLVIGFSIVGSIVAALRALSRGSATVSAKR
jgi:hypothetical protein